MKLSIKAVEKFVNVGAIVILVSIFAIVVSAILELAGVCVVGNAPIYALFVGIAMVFGGFVVGIFKMIFKI